MTEPVQLAKQTTDRLRSAINNNSSGSDSSSLTRVITFSNNEHWQGVIILTQYERGVSLTFTAASSSVIPQLSYLNFYVNQLELPLTLDSELLSYLSSNNFYIGEETIHFNETTYTYTLSLKLSNNKPILNIDATKTGDDTSRHSFSITGILPRCSISS